MDSKGGFISQTDLLSTGLYLWLWNSAGTQKSLGLGPQILSLSEASSCPTCHCCPGTQAPGFFPVPWGPLEDSGAGEGGGSEKSWLLNGWSAVQLGKQDGQC